MNPSIIKTPTQTYLKDFPFFKQLDNQLNPFGACNVTSAAMCLYYFGIRGASKTTQLEDQLYRYAEKQGFSRHTPEGIKDIIEGYAPNIKDDLTIKGSLQDIRDSIDKGNPCIVHSFINSDVGHIFVISGYTKTGFTVQDPYGEWSLEGYDTKATGKNLHYSNHLVASACDSWSHSQFLERYDRKDTSANSIYLHRISKNN